MLKKEVVGATFVEVVLGVPRQESMGKGRLGAGRLLNGSRMALHLKTARLFKCNRFFTILRVQFASSIEGVI